MYEYGTLKPIEVTLRRWRKRENNGGDESNWGTLYTYMEMSQQNPLQLLQPNKIVFNKHSKKKKTQKG
jgi:hypothetical protein